MIYKDQLEAVYRLIGKEDRWTTEDSAKDANGNAVNPLSDEACRWCLDGAFERCGLSSFDSEKALGLPQHETPVFNDSHTHAEVLELLTTAIERAPVRP